jgi:hypothetical protein
MYPQFEKAAIEMGALHFDKTVNIAAAAGSLLLFALNQKGVGNILYDLRERIKMELYAEISEIAQKHMSAMYKEVKDGLKTS